MRDDDGNVQGATVENVIAGGIVLTLLLLAPTYIGNALHVPLGRGSFQGVQINRRYFRGGRTRLRHLVRRDEPEYATTLT